MLDAFIKYFTLIICSLYIAPKLLNFKQAKHTRYTIYSLIFSCLLSCIYLLFSHKYSVIYIPLVGISIYIFIRLFYCNIISTAISCTLYSYALSYVLFAISATLVTFIVVPLEKIFKNTIPLSIYLIIAVVQISLMILIFKIRRFKNGMPFLKSEKFNYIGIYIGLTILICAIILKFADENTYKYFILPQIFVCISSIFIFIWWRSRLKATYIKAVYNRELEILKNELATLKSDNEVLSSLLHKDNKLIPALELTVKNFICSDNPSAQDKDKILAQLNKLSMERKGIINNCSTFNSTLPSTGYMVIDALLNYMMQKCSASDITMNVNIIGNLDTFIGKIIDESDFNTILADLIENAYIATKYNNGKNIHVNINTESKFPALDIYDSGNAFDDNVLMNLGMKRITTHKDNGGTGIGLSSTYGLCKKYNASFVITEDINSENTTFKDTNSKNLISEKSSSNVITFTKKVSIIFDDKSEYRLKTNNDFHNLQKLAKRVDLIIEN